MQTLHAGTRIPQGARVGERSIDPDTGAESHLAHTGGRPLGIEHLARRSHRAAADGSGRGGWLVHDVAGRHERFGMAAGVRQVGSRVWMGSLELSTIAVFDVPVAQHADGTSID